jgi:hypothetical protein
MLLLVTGRNNNLPLEGDGEASLTFADFQRQSCDTLNESVALILRAVREVPKLLNKCSNILTISNSFVDI